MAILSPSKMFNAFQSCMVKGNSYAKDIVCEGKPYCTLYAAILNGKLFTEIQSQMKVLQQACLLNKTEFTFAIKTDKGTGKCVVTLKAAGTRAPRSDKAPNKSKTIVPEKVLEAAQNDAKAANLAKATAIVELNSTEKLLAAAKLEIARLNALVEKQAAQLHALRKLVPANAAVAPKSAAVRLRRGVMPTAVVAARATCAPEPIVSVM